MIHYGQGFLICWNLAAWRSYFSILQGMLSVLIIFFRFCWLFLQTFDVFELLGQIWRFFSNVGILGYGWGFLVHLKLVDWKNHFSKLQGLLESLNNSFRFWLFLQNFDVFKLLEQIWGFLSNFHISHYGQDLLVHLNLVGWKTHFSLLQGLLYCFNNFF